MFGEIAAIYRSSKKKQDINWFTEWLCRPPAAIFVYLLRNTPISPNQVTIFATLLAAVAAGVWIAMPGYWGLVVGVAIFEVSFIFDCVDGMLARHRGITSTLGHLLDFLMDEIKALFIFAAITIRLWMTTGDDLYVFAGFAGLFAIAGSLSLTTFIRRPEYGAAPPTEDGQPAVIKKRKGDAGTVLGVIEHLARSVIHYPQYIWILCIADRVDVFFWVYGGVNVLYLGRTGLAIMLRLGGFAPQEKD
jgi:phosphatidylglycerophosphate synthase